MKQLIVLPTWILVRLMIPILPQTHVWKKKKFTLKDWAENSTDLTIKFSILFWLNIIVLSLIFYLIIIKE